MLVAVRYVAVAAVALGMIAATSTPPPSPALIAGYPAVSPNGSEVAFESGSSGNVQLYSVASIGGRARQLTSSAGDKGPPQWSRDGKFIYFSLIGDVETQLKRVARDGQNVDSVATVAGREAWISPNATSVAFFVGSYLTSSLRTASLGGSNARTLTSAELQPVWSSRWSPDGLRIAFAAKSGAGRNIWVVDADGGHLTQVTHFTPEQGSPEWPAWSPDGHRLVVMVGKLAGGKRFISSLWRIDLDGGAALEITPHSQAYADETPAWFPDGRRVIFQSDRTGAYALRVVNADGSDEHPFDVAVQS
jgi:TolB protein